MFGTFKLSCFGLAVLARLKRIQSGRSVSLSTIEPVAQVRLQRALDEMAGLRESEEAGE